MGRTSMSHNRGNQCRPQRTDEMENKDGNVSESLRMLGFEESPLEITSKRCLEVYEPEKA